MGLIHCMKCKQKTETKDSEVVQNGNRFRECGICNSCGTKKSKFVKKPTDGSGIFDKVQNVSRRIAIKTGATPPVRLLESGEKHIGFPVFSSFTGPSNRTDLKRVRDHPARDSIDLCSKTHDLAYGDVQKISKKEDKIKAIRKADIAAIKCYDKYKHARGNKPGHYLLAHGGITAKMKLEDIGKKTPLGVGNKINEAVFGEFRGGAIKSTKKVVIK